MKSASVSFLQKAASQRSLQDCAAFVQELRGKRLRRLSGYLCCRQKGREVCIVRVLFTALRRFRRSTQYVQRLYCGSDALWRLGEGLCRFVVKLQIALCQQVKRDLEKPARNFFLPEHSVLDMVQECRGSAGFCSGLLFGFRLVGVVKT